MARYRFDSHLCLLADGVMSRDLQPAEKRHVARKHIHLRKRKALADLFKALASAGE